MSVSRKPQNVSSEIWYYENRGNIEIYVTQAELDRQELVRGGRGCISFKIPKRKLIASLKRMQP